MSEWEWPQWIYAIWYGLVFGCALIVDGQPRTGTYNGALIIVLMALQALVLYFGGFWTP